MASRLRCTGTSRGICLVPQHREPCRPERSVGRQGVASAAGAAGEGAGVLGLRVPAWGRHGDRLTRRTLCAGRFISSWGALPCPWFFDSSPLLGVRETKMHKTRRVSLQGSWSSGEDQYIYADDHSAAREILMKSSRGLPGDQLARPGTDPRSTNHKKGREGGRARGVEEEQSSRSGASRKFSLTRTYEGAGWQA